jgi:hypothetical protein
VRRHLSVPQTEQTFRKCHAMPSEQENNGTVTEHEHTREQNVRIMLLKIVIFATEIRCLRLHHVTEAHG